MKVGILTFPHSPSLGAMLQMRALYHVVHELGHEVEIINYVSNKVNHQQIQPVTPKSLLIKVLSCLFLKSSNLSYQDFENKLDMFPELPTCSEEGLKDIAARFDRIVVGSDQVWNPVVTGHDLNFYLKFCKDGRQKVSYAASFGYAHADKEHEAEIAELLNDFAHLSVREQDGQDIIEKLTGRKATLVLDPTLLVQADYLRGVMKQTKREKKYVLFFCIKPSPKLYSQAQAYADAHGYELVTIGGRMKDRFNPKKHPEYGVGPKEFLGLVDMAECVFTNSFHGMAVSIALHSDFYVEFSSDTNSRLINLTHMLRLQERVIGKDIPEERDIDYDKVEELLAVRRELSMNYLKMALTE